MLSSAVMMLAHAGDASAAKERDQGRVDVDFSDRRAGEPRIGRVQVELAGAGKRARSGLYVFVPPDV